MKRKKQQKQFLLYTFFLLLLGIGLGYALIQSDLNLTGTADIGTNSWDIHFANVQVATGSVTATTPATINPSDNTKVNYSITLDKPGDFYEFTVDIVNTGTLPGEISLSTVSGINPIYEDIIEYSINYTNGNPVQVGDILNDGESKTIKVRTYFTEDITASTLPADDFNLNLVLNITYLQADEREFTTTRLINQLKTENSSCFTKYTGQVTDQVGQTVTAQNVYFNRCADKRNIKFAGYCWQMIRTTETGGIKMIYNGEPDNNGECGSSRGDHKGIVGDDGSTQTLNGNYLYGDSFTYNTNNNVFTLTNPTTATWSDSTYEDLIGKFTCKSNSDTCTTIYQINGYITNTIAYISYYSFANTNYTQIGTSSYNPNYKSPAMVGYMFNKVYNYESGAPTSGSLMGNDVSYTNGTYTLLPTSGESTLGTTLNSTHHYTCNNTTGTCDKVRFYYAASRYIELDGEANIEEAVNNMLSTDNVNRYNSAIKGIIDAWYRDELNTATKMLEDTVYCNARNITNHSGWYPDGDLSTNMVFKNFNSTTDLSCPNITDQFSLSNNKAKLTYPIALATHEELYNLTNRNNSEYYFLTKTNNWWWGMSPYFYNVDQALVRRVFADGKVGTNYTTFNSGGIRPVISLAPDLKITRGTGSETEPWIVE